MLTESGAPSGAWSAADGRAVVPLVLFVVAHRMTTALAAFVVNVAFPLARLRQFTLFGETDPLHVWLAAAAPEALRPPTYVSWGVLYGPALTMSTNLPPIF